MFVSVNFIKKSVSHSAASRAPMSRGEIYGLCGAQKAKAIPRLYQHNGSKTVGQMPFVQDNLKKPFKKVFFISRTFLNIWELVCNYEKFTVSL